MEAPNQPIPTEADLISAEAQMKLMQNMMATTADPTQLGTAIPSGPPGPLGEFARPSQPSTEAPSRATSLPDSQAPAEMETSSRDKRAASEGDRDEPTATGRPWIARETEEDQPDHSGKGYQKWPRLDSKGNTRESKDGFDWHRDHRETRSRPRQARQPSYWGGARRSERSDRADRNERSRDAEQALLNLCSALTNLSLRHEEAREQQPGTITLPLRTFLMGNWLKLLRTRFEACLATEEARKQAMEMLVLDPSGAVPYLEWDAQAKAMKIKTDREPMTPDQILELIRQMEAMILAPHGIMRFHATRKLNCMECFGGGGPYDAGVGDPDAGSPQAMGRLRTTESQRGDQGGVHLPEGGQDGAIGSRQHGAEALRRAVRMLRLRNLSNHCYSHAVVSILCWFWATTSGRADADFLGKGLRQLCQWLCTRPPGTPIVLWQHIAWRAFHGGWVEPHRQHDVFEYLGYLRPKLGPDVTLGRWQGRQMHDAHITLLDEGSTWPLLLPAQLSTLEARTGAALTLQHLVDEWECSQAGLHGMTHAPEALLVQINRFEVSPEGTLKVDTPLQPDPYLMIPTYLHDLDHATPLALQYRRYCRVAAILHLGDSPHAGHYRAILYGDTLGCSASAAVRQGLVAPGNQDACKPVSEDVALLQSSRAATSRDMAEEEPANLSYAARGMPISARCASAHGENDCKFKDYVCTRSDTKKDVPNAMAIRSAPMCSLSQLAQNPSATMYAIQRHDGAGTRIGQTLLSLAHAAQNNMNFGGFFTDGIFVLHAQHRADVPRAMSAFLGCNYSELVVHANTYQFDRCWNGRDTLDNVKDGEEILLAECNGISCRPRPDLAVLTLPFLSQLRKSTSLLRHATRYFTGKEMKVVIHIRRGDEVPRNPAAKMVNNLHYASDALYLDFLRMFHERVQNVDVHIISTTEDGFPSQNFDVYRNLGVQVHLDGDIVDDWAHMAQADLLLIAPSTYSWVAGLLNEKCVAIFNFFAYPIVSDWIELSADLHEFKDVESCLSKRGRQRY
ncbi:unnamed protein product [Symbiodinium microadriaticum]|nr:unnamed protein product [Symbiodinium microadriaticum]